MMKMTIGMEAELPPGRWILVGTWSASRVCKEGCTLQKTKGSCSGTEQMSHG